jgi:hypothetical protein
VKTCFSGQDERGESTKFWMNSDSLFKKVELGGSVI